VRPKLVVLAVAVLNLVAGLSFGFVLGRGHAPVGGAERAAMPAMDPDLPSLADALDLPPAQTEKVRAILTSCGPRFDAVIGESRPKLVALHEEILQELTAVLGQAGIERLAVEYHRRYGAVEPLPRARSR
jgi:hypothetical protein